MASFAVEGASMIGAMTKVLVGLLAVGGVGSATILAAAGTPDEQAVVTQLVDGNSFVADIGEDAGLRTETVRLLNVDTPGTTPDTPANCLGPEAAALLESLIPVGSTVTLQYDDKHLDRQGSTLAGVVTSNGALVNAEIARAGLGTAIVLDGDDRFLQPVQAAQQVAAENHSGLYSSDVTCTVPAQVDAVTAAVAQSLADARQAGASAAKLDAAATALADVETRASTLATLFDGDRTGPMFAVLARDEQDDLARRVVAARDAAREGEAALRTAATASRTRNADASGRRSRKIVAVPAPKPATAVAPRVVGAGGP